MQLFARNNLRANERSSYVNTVETCGKLQQYVDLSDRIVRVGFVLPQYTTNEKRSSNRLTVAMFHLMYTVNEKLIKKPIKQQNLQTSYLMKTLWCYDLSFARINTEMSA